MSIEIPDYLKSNTKGSVLDVLVAPRSSRNKIVGEHGGRLKVSLKAPPVDGAANEMLIEFLSEVCRLSPRKLSLVSGLQSKRKSVLFEGVTPEQLVPLLLL